MAETFGKRMDDAGGSTSGFDYMRIVLAVTVLVWHSFPISYGMEAAKEVGRSTPGAALNLILPMFFALSGFLVGSSLDRLQNIKRFVTFRVLRIFPALIVEVLLSALVLGPLITTLPLSTYFSHPEFSSYLWNLIGWIHYNLPGVYENNPIPKTVNVSLWTVPYELECYIALIALYACGLLRKRTILFVFIFISVGALLLSIYKGQTGFMNSPINGRILVLSFLAGVVVFHYRHLIKYSGLFFAISLLISLVLASDHRLIYFLPLPIAYATMYMGLATPRKIALLSAGDFSYGIYLYASPVQQTTAWLLGDQNSWALNVIISLPIVSLIAVFSWFAIEKNFLKLKKVPIRAYGTQILQTLKTNAARR